MISLQRRGSNIYAGAYSLYKIWGVWSGYESTQWLNPPTAPPPLRLLPDAWNIPYSYCCESWK